MKEEITTGGPRLAGIPISHAVHEEILLSLVRNSLDAIVSADGVIDYWNPAAERIYGYKAEEAIGKLATIIVPPNKLDEFEMMQRRLERGERVEQFATQRLRKDGTLIDVDITVFPVMDETGKLAATSVISHDMTEKIRLRKEVEQNAKLKTDFLAKMSHEIRTPLNAIIGTTELQMLSAMTPEQRRRMEVIQSSGELLLSIVDDILDFSKLSAGKLIIENNDLDLEEVVAGITDAFGVLVRSKTIELALFLDPGIPTGLRGDSKRLRQILNNLLSNAIKFTASGEVLLSATKIEETDDGAVVCFEVKDTGIGIAPEVQSELFQPFVQAEQSTSRRFGGTGLGLAISAQLVEQMGGRIEIESALGKGARFHFKLRFEKREQLDETKHLGASGADFSGIRALVVGDGEISPLVISRYLTAWGIENLLVANEAALTELRSAAEGNQNYAVVVLDQGPNNQKLPLARLIRGDAILKDTRVIIVSSDPSTGSSGEVVDSWLTKPLHPSLLFNGLADLFANYDRGDGAIIRPIVQKSELHQTWRKDVHILVVEDNLTNQILIRQQLDVLGYPIHIVDDAPQALKALGQGRYDLVLMDCELPGMDGYKATAEIRRREGNLGHLKIIALTAHVAEDQTQRCLDAGMDGYLSKPVRLQKLAETLDGWSRSIAIAAHNTIPAPSEKLREELDPAALAAIEELSKATGRNVFRDLVDTFLSDLPPRIKLLTTALETSNMTQLARVAHPLKSSSAIVGAQRFSDICAAVERYARDGALVQASSLTGDLLEAAQKLPNALLVSAYYK